MSDLHSRRWAAVADNHIPSIAKSLKRIADALEAISERQAETEKVAQTRHQRLIHWLDERGEEGSKRYQCLGETFSKAESLGWENPLDKAEVTDDTDPQTIDAAEEAALDFIERHK